MLPSISSAISAQESTDTHEAASSMPSGMPSTSRQMRSACEYPASSRAKPGTTCVARSTNRRTAEAPPFPFSARPRPSTSNTHSLWTLSRSREVVRSSTFGARSMISPRSPEPSTRCSKLSSTSSVDRSLR